MAIKKTTRTKQNCNYGDDCPPGQWCNNGTCVPHAKKPGPFSGPSVKVAGAIIGAGLTGMGAYLSAGKKDARKKEKAEKKKVDETAKKITSNVMKKGGSTGDKKWIQKAINPAHKGYCTPMTKPTCTPKRKALAITLKKMAKKK